MNRVNTPTQNPSPKSGLTPSIRNRMTRMTTKSRMMARATRIMEALYTGLIGRASRNALLALFLMVPLVAHAAALLPNGEQTFLDANGDPLASGDVYFYIPTTSTPKDTWQDPNQTSLNTNPVHLDSAGRAIIYGSGSYRQVVKDVDGNTIWDQLTADPSGTSSSWGGTSGGTANAQTVTGGSFSSSSGQVIWFLAGLTNTGSTTLTVGTNSPITVYKDISTGPSPLTGGEIVANNVVGVVYEATAGRFHLIGSSSGFISTVPVTIASATTTNILAATTNQVVVSGTATITSFGSTANRAPIFVTASGAFTLTYNATSLILPGAANITAAAGDTFIVVSDASGNARVVSYTRNLVPYNSPQPVTPQGRLTLTTGTPVMTSDVTAATSVFYTPYVGAVYPWWNGTIWVLRSIAELTLALDSNAGHTGYQQSGKNFDLCLYNDNGTDRLVTLPAWTSDTARASGLTRLNGVWTNTGSVTAKYDTSASTLTIAANQCTYVGTMRASANGQTAWVANPAAAAGGGNCTLYLWNAYNRMPLSASSKDSTDTWSYGTATWRAADNSTSNRVSIVVGLNEDTFVATYATFVLGGAAGLAHLGVGLDSTSATSGRVNAIGEQGTGSTQVKGYPIAEYRGFLGLGFHYIQALEYVDSVSTTFYGDNGGSLDQQLLYVMGNM